MLIWYTEEEGGEYKYLHCENTEEDIIKQFTDKNNWVTMSRELREENRTNLILVGMNSNDVHLVVHSLGGLPSGNILDSYFRGMRKERRGKC